MQLRGERGGGVLVLFKCWRNWSGLWRTCRGGWLLGAPSERHSGVRKRTSQPRKSGVWRSSFGSCLDVLGCSPVLCVRHLLVFWCQTWACLA
eukprot:3870426-Rhodomonas_salina.1